MQAEKFSYWKFGRFAASIPAALQLTVPVHEAGRPTEPAPHDLICD